MPGTFLREDADLSPDDLASSSLNPLFILLSSMESLELLKSDISHARDTEQQLLALMRSLKAPVEVRTCSESLRVIVNDYVDKSAECERWAERLRLVEMERDQIKREVR